MTQWWPIKSSTLTMAGSHEGLIALTSAAKCIRAFVDNPSESSFLLSLDAIEWVVCGGSSFGCTFEEACSAYDVDVGHFTFAFLDKALSATEERVWIDYAISYTQWKDCKLPRSGAESTRYCMAFVGDQSVCRRWGQIVQRCPALAPGGFLISRALTSTSSYA